MGGMAGEVPVAITIARSAAQVVRFPAMRPGPERSADQALSSAGGTPAALAPSPAAQDEGDRERDDQRQRPQRGRTGAEACPAALDGGGLRLVPADPPGAEARFEQVEGDA